MYLRKKLQGQVYAGLYRGLKLPEHPNIACYEAKLLGCYEKELAMVITQFTHQKLNSLTIIGSAEGFHALGLSMLTGLVPSCYESDAELTKQLSHNAETNSLKIETYPSFEANTFLDRPPGLVLMDIEGDETSILTEERLNDWKSHHLIIEIHGEEKLDTIIKRSEKIFQIKFIPCQKRTTKDYPFPIPLRHLLSRWWKVPVQEWRSDSIGWLILSPQSIGLDKPTD